MGALLLPPFLPVYPRPGDAQISEYITVKGVAFPHPLYRPLFAMSACLASILKEVSASKPRLDLGFPLFDVLDHRAHFLSYSAYVRIIREIVIQELMNIH